MVDVTEHVAEGGRIRGRNAIGRCTIPVGGCGSNGVFDAGDGVGDGSGVGRIRVQEMGWRSNGRHDGDGDAFPAVVNQRR